MSAEQLEEARESFECMATALITMADAKKKTSEQRKKRGYGAPTKDGASGNAAASTGPKKCWDCGALDQLSGHKGCPKPGQGLFKPKDLPNFRPGKGKGGKGYQARVAEAEDKEEHSAHVAWAENLEQEHEVFPAVQEVPIQLA